MERVDVLVIGAGIVGAAVTRAFSRRGRSVLLLEQHKHPGTETSSRNSQVIHAGIYYPPESLKAKLCVEGKQRLYDYCRQRDILHRKCGKLIVATNLKQVETLMQLHRQAKANGVLDISFIQDKRQILAMEPQLESSIAALHSPSTGIIDSHALLECLLIDSSQCLQPQQEVNHVMNSTVTGGRYDSVSDKLQIQVDHTLWLHCNTVVNCAGLHAPSIANYFSSKNTKIRHYFAKGNYFSLQNTQLQPFSRLIYPVPEPGGLGIHATIDLNGSIRFGPDVEWIDPSVESPNNIPLTPNEARLDAFYSSIRIYWPSMPRNCLQPDYAGIRPKLHHPHVPESADGSFQQYHDFLIQCHRTHAIRGLINLLGIESPGLTSCLAIAEYCADIDGLTSSHYSTKKP